MKLLISMVGNGVNNTGMNRDGKSQFHTAKGKDLKAKGPGPEERLAPGRIKGGELEGQSGFCTVFIGSPLLRHSCFFSVFKALER